MNNKSGNTSILAAALKVSPSGVRLRTMVVTFLAILLLIAWITVGLGLYTLRQMAIDAEIRQDANVARTLIEQSARVLATVDKATLRIRDAVVAAYDSDNRDRAISELRYKTIANETGLSPEVMTQLVYVDASGRFVGGNLDPTGETTGAIDLSSREHIQVHLAPNLVPDAARRITPGGLFIGKPVLGKVSGIWTIQISRKITDPKGRTLGVIVASLNPAYFEQVYSKVLMGPAGTITLVGDDDTVRARVVGGRSLGMGETDAAASKDSESVKMESNANYLRPDEGDGINRIYVSQRIPGYPLRIVISNSTQWALESWSALRDVALVLVLLLSLATIGAAVLFLQTIGKLEDSAAELVGAIKAAEVERDLKEAATVKANTDFLTGISNRRYFIEMADRELNQSLMNDAPFSLLVLDVDFFKKINDSFGHDAGDLVLKNVAQTVKNLLRDIDVFGRIGGEEFAVALVETPIAEAEQAANRLREAIARLNIVIPSGQQVMLTASIGLAAIDDKRQSLADLLKEADLALYEAKHAGRNCVRASG